MNSSLLTKNIWLEDPRLPLSVHLRDPQPEFPLHAHEFSELVIILKGTALHCVHSRADAEGACQMFPVKRGDAFVIAPGTRHQYRQMHNLALVNLLFDPRALRMEEWDIHALPGFHALFALEPAYRHQHQFRSRLQLGDAALAEVQPRVNALLSEIRAQTPGYRVMAIGHFMQLVVILSRLYTRQPDAESMDLLRIGDAIAHLETCYADPVTLPELARKACLSPRQFQRVFHTCMGCSPMEHLLSIRLRRARELLRTTPKPVTEIAYECGFSDSNYFARVFRQHCRQTPTAFRKSGRAGTLKTDPS
jgi:AraC family L-rhamnose operon transcriptional activator RhaR